MSGQHEKSWIDALPDCMEITGIGITRAVIINDEVIDPARSQRVLRHSPDGFNWGYAGSGPAQLALAILLTVMPEKEAVAYHQDFKSIVIGALPSDGFKIKVNMRGYVERRLNGSLTTYNDIVETLVYTPSTFRIKVKKSHS